MITFACEIWDQSTKDIGGKLYSPVVPQVLLNSFLLLPQFCKGMTWECSWLARKSVSGSWRLWLSLSTKDTAEVLSCSVSKLNVTLCIPLFLQQKGDRWHVEIPMLLELVTADREQQSSFWAKWTVLLDGDLHKQNCQFFPCRLTNLW